MKQVRNVFANKRDRLGARTAAAQVGASLASFYNYANGTDLPRIEVLQAAQEKWGVRWDYLDASELLRKRRVASAEQLLLPVVQSVRAEDVEVVAIGPKKSNILKVTLNIRFSA